MAPTAKKGVPLGPGPGGADGAGNGDESADEGAGEGRRRRKDRLWPILIMAGLALVFLVNGLFIYIAVKGADEIVPSYLTEER